tara:strand:- start:120 stop:536 length:417 start_codon:yes stop_codon:yes gene_type:complete
MTEIMCDNANHKVILNKYLRYVKSVIYYATEDETIGKFSDFNDIIETIIDYSNEFAEDAKKDTKHIYEWRYMLPNLVLFTSIGFLSGINSRGMKSQIETLKKSLTIKTSDLIGQISDIYEEEQLTETYYKEFEIKITK